MLNTLLESRSHRTRSKGTVLTSAIFHTAVILGAVYATASGVSAHDAPEPPVTIHWVAAPPSDPLTQPRRTPRTAPAKHIPSTRRLRVALNVPVSLPPIDANPPESPPIVVPSDFKPSPPSTAGAPKGPVTPTAAGIGAPAYDVSQVDSPVSMLGTFRPDYPAQLRSSGVEGDVIVQFVVNESGRVDRESIRILSASSELFAISVRNALGRMRFIPARLGNSVVAQLVQQKFVFRLDR